QRQRIFLGRSPKYVDVCVKSVVFCVREHKLLIKGFNMTDPKVYILDGGTLVLDNSDIFWHVDPGNPVRFPVYSVLVEHSDALILFDTGFDLEHTKKELPFELPEQSSQQTIPAQLSL